MTESWSERLSALVGVVALCLAALFLVQEHSYFYDDAFITLRYARHLAEGFGPRWNLAGPAVEGFTSPLHVLLIAFLLKLKVGAITAPRMIAFAFHLVLVIWVWRWSRPRFGSLGATIAASSIATSFAMLFWDLGGLEAVPFAALCTCATLAMLSYADGGGRRYLIAGSVLWGLACLTRLDGLVPAVYTAALVCLTRPVDRKERLRDVAIFAAFLALALVPYEAFRLAYFHQLLPNTYYAKVYGIPRWYLIGSGRHYLHLFAATTPFPLPLLVAVAAAQAFFRVLRPRSLFLIGWIGVVILFVVANGGDYMFGFRFLLTTIPIIYVAIVQGLSSLGLLDRPRTAIPIAVGLLFLFASQFRTADSESTQRGHHLTGRKNRR